MVTSLPRHVRLKLDQTLAQWRHWQCVPALQAAPEVVSLLGDGHSNFNVLVAERSRFVVRIDGINPAGHGLSRQAEWRALQAAASAGLAPRPRYFNPDLGSLVCDFLAPDTQSVTAVTDTAALLRAIHRLPARRHRLDLGERTLRYEKQLEHRGVAPPEGLARCRPRVLAILEDIASSAQPLVLCHNDLLQANRVYSEGRLWAIDWEYCAMASPWYELAVITVGDSLGPEQAAGLVQAYLGHAPASDQQQLLHRYACVYRYLELLWYHCLERPALAPSALAGKLTALERALVNP